MENEGKTNTSKQDIFHLPQFQPLSNKIPQ